MMNNNQFYNDFDIEVYGKRKARDEDYRTPFQIDRDRIIYSSAFRRLQSKTQVFLSGEYDFYRTRLTHSLEVAQIARSIGQYLLKTSPLLSEHFYIDLDLIEAVSLSHDLGHPPFGHTGEKVLQSMMEQNGSGGFEGNAQTLRIITELIYSTDLERTGMSPTRAFLDGIMKYKNIYGESNSKKYLLADQKKYLAFVYDCDENSLPPVSRRNQSIECQIMDWADNTAYSINDLIDGYKAGFISREKLTAWLTDDNPDLTDNQRTKLNLLMENLTGEYRLEKYMAREIGQFIKGVELQQDTNFMSHLTNRYAFKLHINPQIAETYKLYAMIATDLIFKHSSIQQLEFKGTQIIKSIFNALYGEYSKEKPLFILPPMVHKQVIAAKDAKNKNRIICDHIAGMTDGFVQKTYKRLFSPDSGSIVDLV